MQSLQQQQQQLPQNWPIILHFPRCPSSHPAYPLALITRARDNFGMFPTTRRVSQPRRISRADPEAEADIGRAKPRKPIVSSWTAVPTNFRNDTCTCTRSTWLTYTGRTSYWETTQRALNVLTHFPIWILPAPRKRRKSSFTLVPPLGLPSGEQTRAIKAPGITPVSIRQCRWCIVR